MYFIYLMYIVAEIEEKKVDNNMKEESKIKPKEIILPHVLDLFIYYIHII